MTRPTTAARTLRRGRARGGRDAVTAGQPIITYDVPAIVAAGLSPVVPVVVMDERDPGNITVGTAVGTSSDIDSGAMLFTANKQ